ncbi:pyruvate:ferredoxin (flavodoxin) oxidoreductase [Endozoicomonas sp. (ex Bugula neritina AB1)]|nr:pyruvate:ferredoxin (flavodoxin) oxidoreductase [Endozoicomonas sp. (ex Bugula neritina AB1)]
MSQDQSITSNVSKEPARVTIDGNEAAAYIAYRTNEVCAIYPITPSSSMAELAEEWAAQGIKNIWGGRPHVAQMQSEAGAAGAVHGSLQTGAMTTTFTASQGLMLMLPNMYKIAGELTPAVFYVAARSLATQGLSIFGDHQDVMAARSTGFAMLAASSVQEAHDLALIAQAATLESRVPFMHFFDGFRTSHEVNKISLLPDTTIRAMIDDRLVQEHRRRALNPESPKIRGTAQNPDVYFQARESCNAFYEKTPDIVEAIMWRFAGMTGRHYRPFHWYGPKTAKRLIIIMGSGAETVKMTMEAMNRELPEDDKVALIQVRLYRPFSAERFLHILPESITSIAVLDRTKEPGASGEPLYQDVMTVLSEDYMNDQVKRMPRVIGGRYGLSSKEFTPGMVKAVYEELLKEKPKNHFTIGINDDVTHSSLTYDTNYVIEDNGSVRAMFFGLGADGTVGANKNSIKIIGSDPKLNAQAYFVYDSKKSGSQTVSHLRFGEKPIEAPYLIQAASFVACHQFNFLEKTDVLANIEPGGVFLLNSPYGVDEVWEQLPRRVQEQLVEKRLNFHVIDGSAVARAVGMGNRTNTIMQTCFFALSGVLPRDEAITRIKKAIEQSYRRKGDDVVERNFRAVDQTLEHLYKVTVPEQLTPAGSVTEIKVVSDKAPDFIKNVTSRLISGEGDLIPVSQIPVDGTWLSGSSRWEKRNIALQVPEWDEEVCIQCGNCSLVCPHAAIRARFYNEASLTDAPEGFKSAPISARGFPETRYTLQCYPEDCTGCGLCVEACPVRNPKKSGKRALNLVDKEPILEQEKESLTFFEQLPLNDRRQIDFSTVRGVQFLEPLFEFSGACGGCGETPYLKLLTQLFGDRLMVANATGCSSIYGGNLPTTPWSLNAEGRGPAWANSLFEDNAEFGFGFRLSSDHQAEQASLELNGFRLELGDELVDAVIHASQENDTEIHQQRERLKQVQEKLAAIHSPAAESLKAVLDRLLKRVVWIVGGDGWAYDIGSGGLDHVLASGRNVNVLVMDTEVYSNTGGQASKSTPMGAVAKFAAAGKRSAKKDVALQAISYGNVYVARIAMGASPQQTLQALREAEAWPGPSLVIAYSHCIAHGINMTYGMEQQRLAVRSGHWPLFRYNPGRTDFHENPFELDSLRPNVPLTDYIRGEVRYRALSIACPEEAEGILSEAQKVINRKWGVYEEMATHNAMDFVPEKTSAVH